MHPNEIRITQDNRDILMEEAERMGKAYVAALKEQIERQSGKTK
jgi:hypothetical protein